MCNLVATRSVAKELALEGGVPGVMAKEEQKKV